MPEIEAPGRCSVHKDHGLAAALVNVVQAMTANRCENVLRTGIRSGPARENRLLSFVAVFKIQDKHPHIAGLSGWCRPRSDRHRVEQLAEVCRVHAEVRSDVFVRHRLQQMRTALAKLPETLLDGEGM